MTTLLLLPDEADKILRYPPGRCERLARRGKLPHITLPDGAIRFQRDAIDAIVAGSPRSPTTTQAPPSGPRPTPAKEAPMPADTTLPTIQTAAGPIVPLSVSLADGAKLIGVCERTLARLAAAGTIRTVKVGARRLVPVAELQRLLTGGDE